MWLQVFEAPGPQVFINIPLCVRQPLKWVPTCLEWDEWELQKIKASKKRSILYFCASHLLITDPLEEWCVELEGLRAIGDVCMLWAGLVEKGSAGYIGKARVSLKLITVPSLGTLPCQDFCILCARLHKQWIIVAWKFVSSQMFDLTTRKFLPSYDRAPGLRGDALLCNTIVQITQCWRACFMKGTVPSSTLTRKPLFFLPFVHNYFSYWLYWTFSCIDWFWWTHGS